MSVGVPRRVVERIVPIENAWDGPRGERYLIPGGVVREVEAEARGAGLEVVGFYHSHPDAAPVPSAFDLEVGWPWYTYLIVGVSGGAGRQVEPGEVRGWQMRDDRARFLEVELLVGG